MTKSALDPNTFAGRKAERDAREAVEGVPDRRKLALDVGEDTEGVGVTFTRREA